ncbi:unnamed protein product, partial [Clonostachys rosea f. rosea IK726]
MDSKLGADRISTDEASILYSYESNDMTYEFTNNTFKKISRLPFNRPWADGTPFEWSRPWNHERITNEVNALKLISQRTTIPVPKIIDYGYYEDGRRYLVTELIEGVTLKDIQQLGCSKPMGQKHTLVTPCKTCSDQAYASALQFIEDHVLPQLAMLKAKERGIDGFVMPPSWLSPIMAPWKGKKSWKTLPLDESKYTFQHGDLAAHNIMMDPMLIISVVRILPRRSQTFLKRSI